ncbi:MAG: hypothetical protein LBM96_02050 [Methanobrevibacter sp.]|jgi:energy-converting hydrogenase B subunit C|nr:hypothetical protein [Candidatus Methanoflexus mossambicus]
MALYAIFNIFALTNIIDLIRAILLIISAIFIVFAAIGILRIDSNQKNGIYAKIQILGIVDMAGVLAMIALNQIFLAAIYFILAPVLAHAMANAYYYGEDLDKDEKDERTVSLNNFNSINKVNEFFQEVDSDRTLNNKSEINRNKSEINRNKSEINTKKAIKISEKKEIRISEKKAINLDEEKVIALDDENYTISTLKINESEEKT